MAVLEVLASEGEAYSIEIAQRVYRRTDGVLRLKLGSIGSAIDTLAKNGLVTTARMPMPAKHRQKQGHERIYARPTERGLLVAQENRKAMQQFSRPVEQVLRQVSIVR